MGSREPRRRPKREEPAAEHPLLELGVRSEEGSEGGVVSGAGRRGIQPSFLIDALVSQGARAWGV